MSLIQLKWMTDVYYNDDAYENDDTYDDDSDDDDDVVVNVLWWSD